MFQTGIEHIHMRWEHSFCPCSVFLGQVCAISEKYLHLPYYHRPCVCHLSCPFLLLLMPSIAFFEWKFLQISFGISGHHHHFHFSCQDSLNFGFLLIEWVIDLRYPRDWNLASGASSIHLSQVPLWSFHVFPSSDGCTFFKINATLDAFVKGIKRIGSDVTNTCLLKAMRQSSRNSRTICGEGGVPTKVGMSCNGKSNRLFSLYCIGFVEWKMSRNTQFLPLNYPNSSYSSSVSRYLNKSSQWCAGSWSFIFSRCLLQGPRVRRPQVLNRPSSCTFQVKSAWIKQQTQWRTLTRSNQYDK